MIDEKFAQRFANEWEESWNSHDLERILSHYSDDFEMTSPVITSMVGELSGSLKGKDKIEAYWKAALQKMPDLRFEVVDVLASIDTIIIYYKAVMGKRGAEIMFFDNNEKVIKSIAHYDKLSFVPPKGPLQSDI